MNSPRYRRILLKLSGEVLAGTQGFGIDPPVIARVARQIRELTELGVQVGVVIGGGNIFRGLAASNLGMDRVNADYMGMLATLINAMALQDCLEKMGVPTRVMTAINVQEVAEPYIRRRAIRHLEKGRVIIMAAGTGNPFFTTDTAASLRAVEIGAEVIMKATKVDGVYTADPARDPNARRIDRLTFRQALDQDLRVMDRTAFTLCMENDMPIMVFDMFVPGNMERAARGEDIGTWVVCDRPPE